MKVELDKLNSKLCNYSLLRKASRRISLAYDRMIAPSGLTTAQFAILVEIACWEHDEGPTMAELADALVMDRAALTQSLKPLIAGKLVSIKGSSVDRRSRHAHLSALGLKRLEKASALWAQAQTAFAEAFGEEESIALRALLSMVIRRVGLPPLPKRRSSGAAGGRQPQGTATPARP